MKSNEEYVENPDECPHCGSSNIHEGDLSPGKYAIFVNVDCHDCGSYWTDEYGLVGYTSFEVGDRSALEVEED